MPTQVARRPSKVWDILTVRLSAQGYPDAVRLALPAQPNEHNRFTLISARSRALVEHLEAKWGEAQLEPAKLKEVTDTIRSRRPLRAPVLGLSRHSAEVSEFFFVSGQHRITVLHLLGARRIPVAVPWHCAEDFLDHLG